MRQIKIVFFGLFPLSRFTTCNFILGFPKEKLGDIHLRVFLLISTQALIDEYQTST